MARPPIPLKFEHTTEEEFSAALLYASEGCKRRLKALLAICDCPDRREASQLAGASTRTIQRWLKLFNTGGLQALITGFPRSGRKRKFDLLELDAKLWPLIGPSRGSVAKVRQQLAQKHQIQVSYTTLRGYLGKLGYLAKQTGPPNAHVRPPKSSTKRQWTKPWPEAYGESLADYISKQAEQGR